MPLASRSVNDKSQLWRGTETKLLIYKHQLAHGNVFIIGWQVGMKKQLVGTLQLCLQQLHQQRILQHPTRKANVLHAMPLGHGVYQPCPAGVKAGCDGGRLRTRIGIGQ